MSNIKKLYLISKELSKLMGIELIMSFKNTMDISRNSMYLKYKFSFEEEYCYIFTKKKDALTNREQILIQYLISENIEQLNKTDSNYELFKRIITIELSEIDRRDIINRLNVDRNDLVSVIIIKAFKESLYSEIISLISTIDLDVIQTVRLDDKSICILFRSNNLDHIKAMSEAISYAIESEILGQAKIGVGTIRNMIDINKSYKEAISALDIGIRYKSLNNIYYYNDLLIYNLISYMELDSIKDFYNQSIDKSFNELNKEDINTANVLIDNDLKLSQAAKQLYIHRNTLLYRIERINKITTLDLRIFNDAMTFRILNIIYKTYKYSD